MSQIMQPKQTITDEPDKDTTLSDVLKAINTMSTGIDQRFDHMETQMVTKEDLKHELTKFATKEDLKHELAATETRLVTKPYLDEKLYDLKGDLIVIARKEDRKVDSVVSLLRQKNIFSAQEAAEVLSTAVFPKPVTP